MSPRLRGSAPMYICICNALTDRDVAAAIDGGSATVEDVYSFNGCQPQCGRCMLAVRRALNGRSGISRGDTYTPYLLAAE